MKAKLKQSVATLLDLERVIPVTLESSSLQQKMIPLKSVHALGGKKSPFAGLDFFNRSVTFSPLND